MQIRISKYKYFLIVIFVNAIAVLASAQQSDFLIISQPYSLQILNKYEQRLTSSELAGLPQFLPAEIIESNEVLSDEYTNALKISYAGKIYFLPKNSDNQIVNKKNASYYKIYYNVTLVNDTIKILESGKFVLQTPYPDKADKISVPKNTQLIRIFKNKSDYYVLIPGAVNRFGWMRFPYNNYWEKIKNVSTQPDLKTPDIIAGNIISKTEQVNAVYRDLFRLLNKQTGTNHAAPQWTVDRLGGALQLKFIPSEYGSNFAESNSRFIQEIEYLLLGSDYTLKSLEDPFKYIIYAPQAN